MSNSAGPKAQKRPIDVHAQHGTAHRRVNFPRSRDIDLKATYPKPRRVDHQPPVPTAKTLPVPQPTPFAFRDGVHIPQDYRPTAFPMKVSAPRETQPEPDTVINGMTKVIGKENRRGWRTTKITAKTERKRHKADKWLAKNGHQIKSR